MGFFDARFATYLAVATLLIVTPGPDTALVTRNALLTGRRTASFTTLGIGAGSIIWALASATSDEAGGAHFPDDAKGALHGSWYQIPTYQAANTLAEQHLIMIRQGKQ